MPKLEYIETETMNVECYRLNEKKKWELNVYSLEEGQENIEVNFSSVDLRCPISALYEDVVFPDKSFN